MIVDHKGVHKTSAPRFMHGAVLLCRVTSLSSASFQVENSWNTLFWPFKL